MVKTVNGEHGLVRCCRMYVSPFLCPCLGFQYWSLGVRILGLVGVPGQTLKSMLTGFCIKNCWKIYSVMKNLYLSA